VKRRVGHGERREGRRTESRVLRSRDIDGKRKKEAPSFLHLIKKKDPLKKGEKKKDHHRQHKGSSNKRFKSGRKEFRKKVLYVRTKKKKKGKKRGGPHVVPERSTPKEWGGKGRGIPRKKKKAFTKIGSLRGKKKGAGTPEGGGESSTWDPKKFQTGRVGEKRKSNHLEGGEMTK